MHQKERNMKKYIIKRILILIPMLLALSFVTFGLMFLAPGDPAQMKLKAQGIVPSADALEAAREEMGLTKPFLVQYGRWLLGVVRGDFGTSYKKGTPVITEMLRATKYTGILALSSILLTLAVSVPLGMLAAMRQNKISDYMIRFLSFLGNAFPRFLTAVFLMYFFCIRMKLFSILGKGTPKDLVLPTIAMSVGMISMYIRHIRAEILEQLGKSYVTGSRARGDRESIILFKNVFRNSLVTLLTLTGLSIAGLLGGSVVIETIFGWPGLGKMVMDAITNRDYPVIQGFAVWMCTIYMIINLLTDLAYQLIDPRVREG